MKPKTFAELEEASEVKVEDLKATLADYAQNGWSINPRVVIDLLKQVVLTKKDSGILFSLANEGFEVQNAKGKSQAAREYWKVATFIQGS